MMAALELPPTLRRIAERVEEPRERDALEERTWRSSRATFRAIPLAMLAGLAFYAGLIGLFCGAPL